MAQTQPAAPQLTFLDQFEKDYRTILLIPDPLPNVERVLTSPNLNKLWDTGRLTQAIRRSNPNATIPSLQAVWAIVLQNSRWVPSEVAIGLPDAAWGDFDHLMRGMLLFNMQMFARNAATPAERDQMQKDLAAEMSQVRMPAMRVWVNFRAEEDAASLFSLIADQIKNFAASSPMLKVQSTETALQMSLSFADMLPNRAQQMDALSGMGLITGPTDANAGALADALVKMRFDASIERRGSGLRVTLGQSKQGQPLTAADLGTMFAQDPRTILFTVWDIEKLIKASAGWDAMVQKWAGTSIGKAAAQSQAREFMSSLTLMARQLETAAPRGASRMWGTDNGMQFRLLQEGADPAEALAQSPLLHFIPAGAEAFSADTFASLSARFAVMMEQLELRMSQQEAQERSRKSRPGQPPPSDDNVPHMTEAYQKHFARFRQFVTGEGVSFFKPGFAMVFGSQGVVKAIEIESAADPKERFVGSNLPMIEFAMIGVPRTSEQGEQYAQQVYDTLVEGIVSVVNANRGGKPPVAKPAGSQVVPTDLGLGVKTFTFNTGWMTDLASDLKFKIEGDLRPHYFVHDGTLVFSTSPRLSKQMLDAARANQAVQLPPPPAEQQGPVIGYGKLDGKLGAAMVSDIGVWVSAMMQQLEPGAGAAKAHDFADFTAGVADYIALIDRSEWRAWQKGDRRTSSGGITFVP